MGLCDSPGRKRLFSLLLPGLGLGLWLSRLLAESSLSGWRAIWLLPLALVGALIGVGAVALLKRGDVDWRPLILLWVYVLWPSATRWGGLSLGALVFGILLIGQGPRWRRTGLLPLAVFLGAVGLYVATLSPGLLPADAGEFQLVGATLGIAHPPGYALYTMLAKLATLLLPFGTPAFRINLFAALTSAGTLALLAHVVQWRTRSAAAAMVACLFLGLAATFWVQSTTANVRSLTLLFLMATIASLLHWQEEREPRWLTLAALAFGLGVGHHASLAFMAIPFAVYVLWVEPGLWREPRRWAGPALALVAAFAVWFYLPIRSAMQPAFDPNPIGTLRAFREHVMASGFRGDMFAYRSWPILLGRARVYWDILVLQFGMPMLLASLLAAIPLVRKRPRLATMLLGIWTINSLVTISYRAPQTVEYLLPAYLALAALLGFGVASLCETLQRRTVAATLLATLLLFAGMHGLSNLPSLLSLHEDDSTRRTAETLLDAAPPDALILANWHQATPLWYLQIVEGRRPDVEVAYVYPEGATANETVWLRRIDEAIGERPVLVTNRYHGYEHRDYRWEAFIGGWRVHDRALVDTPGDMRPLASAFGDAIAVLGYRISSETVAPAQTMRVSVYWQALETLPDSLSSFCQIVGPDGAIAQGDLVQSASPDGRRVDTYDLTLFPQTAPGEYRLITGFYTRQNGAWQRLISADGDDHLVLSSLDVVADDRPAPTLHPQQVVYASGLEWVGYDADCSLPGQTRLYLHWRQRPEILALGPWRGPEPQAVNVQAWRDGQLLAQREVPRLDDGETATIALDLPSGDQVALRVVTPDGNSHPCLVAWNRHSRRDQSLDLPIAGAAYVPLGGEMVFCGLEQAPEHLEAGSGVSFVPRWLSSRALTQDYAVSLGLRAVDGSWEVKSDGTPALGAIPTLKWLEGWLVRDPRSVTVPDVARGSGAVVTLEVYDAFALQPLAVLDERRVKQGQGVTLQLGTVAVE